MPESIFKQVSLDILRLHQQTFRSLLATQGGDGAEVHDAVYATLDGHYYVLLPEAPAQSGMQPGIFLIENDITAARLSWVAQTRPVQQKSGLHRRAIAALQRRMRQTKQTLDQAANACLLELIPQQGRLTISNDRDFALSPADLMKALYPATQNMEKYAM